MGAARVPQRSAGLLPVLVQSVMAEQAAASLPARHAKVSSSSSRLTRAVKHCSPRNMSSMKASSTSSAGSKRITLEPSRVVIILFPFLRLEPLEPSRRRRHALVANPHSAALHVLDAESRLHRRLPRPSTLIPNPDALVHSLHAEARLHRPRPRPSTPTLDPDALVHDLNAEAASTALVHAPRRGFPTPPPSSPTSSGGGGALLVLALFRHRQRVCACRPHPGAESRPLTREVNMVLFNNHQLSLLTGVPTNIRHVALFATTALDKAALIQSLLEAAGIILPEVGTDENEPASSDVSFVYKMDKESMELYKGDSNEIDDKDERDDREHRDVRNFLINMINVSEDDSPTEAASSICISDGTLCVIDCITELPENAKTYIQQALLERVRPVLCLNVPEMQGSSASDFEQDGEVLYGTFCSIIKGANAVLETAKDKLLGDFRFDPIEGNVLFSCCLSGWGYTLATFAKFWSPRLNLSESEMLEKLWGDHFYDHATKKWTAEHTGSEKCKRGFVHFCLDTMQRIMSFCVEDNKDAVWKALGALPACKGLKRSMEMLTGKSLMNHVMKTWLPIARTVLETIILTLPSPVEAQKYRVGNLYNGAFNAPYANSVKACKSAGPLVFYASKILPESEKGGVQFVCGHVFSGSVQSGMHVLILGPDRTLQHKKKATVRSIQVWRGREKKLIDTVKCGNKVILGPDETVNLHDTISNRKLCGRIRAISIPLLRDQEVADVTIAAEDRKKHLRLPYSVYDDLYPHQCEGIIWLWELHCKKMGGILADDMGLGKSGRFNGKNDATSLISFAKQGGILLTSYETFRMNVKLILKKAGSELNYLYLDEGHRIKHSDIETSKSLLSMKSDHKIVISGTPLQNDLMEFYELVNFCNPNLLGNIRNFMENFSGPIDRVKYQNANVEQITKSKRASQELKEIVDTYILRRTKQLLRECKRLTSEKFEVTIWLEINPLQQSLYKALFQDNMLKTRKKAFAGTLIARDITRHPHLALRNEPAESGTILSPQKAKASLKLRENLRNHLMATEFSTVHSDHYASARFDFVVYLVSKLLREGHYILIFSPSPGVLELLECSLATETDEKRMFRMDGGTSHSDRLKLIEDFQSGLNARIFLLTTKVGGMGITLTKASSVIILDPSDNPSDDSQAIDRAYRIGQKKDVLVYRLIMSGTIEERVYRNQILKGEIACAVLNEEQCTREIAKQESYALSMPSRGFSFSITHNQLVSKLGNEFDRSIKDEIESINIHESVVDVFNHNLLFSFKEQLPVGHLPTSLFSDMGLIEADEMQGHETKKEMVKKNVIEKKIMIPQKIVPFLKAERAKRLKEITRSAGVAADIVETSTSEYQEVILTGYINEILKAEKLIQDVIEKTIIEEIHIEKGTAGLVIGARGKNIHSIQEESGSHIQVKNTVEDDIVIVYGSGQQVEVAKRMIMKLLKGRSK